jgi:phosphatidylserine/phosphatidylglycerophosphate/cardiolipin synthase-like enzyme
LGVLVACGGSNASTSTTKPNGDDGGGTAGDDGSGDDAGTLPDGAPAPRPDGGSSPTKDGGGAPVTDSGGPIVGTTGVTVFVTPSTTLADDMVDAINSAKKSIHMTMYILDNSKIVPALVAQKKAGLEVEVVMNQTFPSGTNESNPTTYATLQAANVGVVWRNGPPNAASGAYTHEKTFILDGTQAWIMTINLDTDSFIDNREYAVVDNDATDVAEADAIFTADFSGAQTTDGNPLVVSPNNSRAALVALINSATKTLDVEDEEFSDNDKGGITAAVAAAASRGIPTRVILANTTPESTQTTAIATVKAAGAKVVISGGSSSSSTSTNPYIHAKAITVDCAGTTCVSAYIGSENMTGGSLSYNRELGVIISNQTEIAKVETAINADYAAGTAQ